MTTLNTIAIINKGNFTTLYREASNFKNELENKVSNMFAGKGIPSQHAGEIKADEDKTFAELAQSDLKELGSYAQGLLEGFGNAVLYAVGEDVEVEETAEEKKLKLIEKSQNKLAKLTKKSLKLLANLQGFQEDFSEIGAYHKKELTVEQLVYTEERTLEYYETMVEILEVEKTLAEALEDAEGATKIESKKQEAILVRDAISAELEGHRGQNEGILVELSNSFKMLMSNPAPMSAEKAAAFNAAKAKVENKTATEADIQVILGTLQSHYDGDHQLEAAMTACRNKVEELLMANPQAVRLVLPSAVFLATLPIAGPAAAFAARTAASAALEGYLPKQGEEASEQAKVAAGAIEAALAYALGGARGAMASAGATAVQNSSDSARTAATVGSVAYMAQLTGVSVVTAAQIGLLGTLALKKQDMVASIYKDLKAGFALIRNPRKIPGAIAGVAKRTFKAIKAAVKARDFKQLGTRALVVLTPVVGILLGVSGIGLALASIAAGSYITDKFFKVKKKNDKELQQIADESNLVKQPSLTLLRDNLREIA